MNTSDPFRGLNAFVRAAESRSFTGAARVLGLTPSAVSKAVTRLEQELAVRLFNRSPREVTLTPEGQEFFSHCQELVHGIEDARALVVGASLQPQGLLRVSAPVSFGQFVLAKALPAWLSAFPGIRVDVVLTDRITDLAEERLDVAIRMGSVPDSRLVARPLGSMPFATAASKKYLKRHGRPVTPSDLNDHACLGYLLESTGGLRQWEFHVKGRRVTIEPRGPLGTGHASVLLDAAKGGLGIVQAPRFLLREAIDDGALEEVLNGYSQKGPQLTVVYPRNRHGSRKLQEFVSFLYSLAAR